MDLKKKILSVPISTIINKLTVKWKPLKREKLTSAHNGVAHGI